MCQKLQALEQRCLTFVHILNIIEVKMWKILWLLAFEFGLLDIWNASLGLWEVCWCQVEIMAVKVIYCTDTISNPLGNFLSELYGFFEAFEVRNLLWHESVFKKGDKDDSCGRWHTGSRGNTGFRCPCSAIHNTSFFWAVLLIRSSSWSEFKRSMYTDVGVFGRMLLNPYQFSTPWSVAPQNTASAQTKVQH